MRIGLSGLGHMGGALAQRLLASHTLRVFDPKPEAVAELQDAGAVAASGNDQLGAECDLVCLCLPTSEHVRSAVLGRGGIAEAMRPGGMIVDHSTCDPGVIQIIAATMAAKGIELVDAPVSGGPSAAAAGQVVIMVGATPEQFSLVMPVLSTISSNVFHVGPPGAGYTVKIANNMITATQRLVTLEAVSLLAKNGVALESAAKVIAKSSGRNYTVEHTLPRHILSGKLFQGCSLATMHKDLQLALKLARESDVPGMFAGLAAELYQIIMNEQGSETEVNAMAFSFERMANTRITPEGSSLDLT